MAYADAVVEHVAGLIQTYLGASCKSVQRFPPVFGPPDGLMPCLTVYRRTIEPKGAPPNRRYHGELAVGYQLGRTAADMLEDAWGSLFSVVKIIDEAVIRRMHASYHSGDRLETCAAIESISLTSVRFAAALADGDEDGAYPAVECTLAVIHHASFTPADAAALEKMVLTYNEIAGPGDPAHPGMKVGSEWEAPVVPPPPVP